MHSPNNPYRYELEQLAKVLTALESLDVLPGATTPEARAMDHDEWIRRHHEITDLYRDAKEYALLSVPPEVKDALDRVKRRKNVLLNVEEWDVTYKRIQEEKAKKGGDTPAK